MTPKTLAECAAAWNDIPVDLRSHVKWLEISKDEADAGSWDYTKQHMMISVNSHNIHGTINHEFGHVMLDTIPDDKHDELVESFGDMPPITNYSATFQDAESMSKMMKSGKNVANKIDVLATFSSDGNITDEQFNAEIQHFGMSDIFEEWKLNRSNVATKGMRLAKNYYNITNHSYANEQFAEFMGAYKGRDFGDVDMKVYGKMLKVYDDVMGTVAASGSQDILQQLDDLAAAWDESKVNRDEAGKFSEKPGSKYVLGEDPELDEMMDEHLDKMDKDQKTVYDIRQIIEDHNRTGGIPINIDKSLGDSSIASSADNIKSIISEFGAMPDTFTRGIKALNLAFMPMGQRFGDYDYQFAEINLYPYTMYSEGRQGIGSLYHEAGHHIFQTHVTDEQKSEWITAARATLESTGALTSYADYWSGYIEDEEAGQSALRDLENYWDERIAEESDEDERERD